jgi:DnaJ like chaperone protein
MNKYAKWIGGGLGWAFGGPLGAVLGFAVGSMFDNTTMEGGQGGQTGYGGQGQRYRTAAADFSASLLVLSAAVMKADGKVLKSELDYVRSFYSRQFGEAAAKQQMLMLKDVLKKDIPLRQVCEQIRHNMQHPLRLQLMHYLFGIAEADGHVDKTEADVIKQIAGYLGISNKDFESISAMFYKDTESAYKILEISPSASESEVKKAYRKMAVKYHPDKVSQLGEEFQKGAKEKFQKVQDAYDTIKKERGMS